MFNEKIESDMNKYFVDLTFDLDQGTEGYNLVVEAIEKQKGFTTDSILRAVNKKLPKGRKLTRKSVEDTLRVLIKSKLLKYDLDKQLIIINKTTEKCQ